MVSYPIIILLRTGAVNLGSSGTPSPKSVPHTPDWERRHSVCTDRYPLPDKTERQPAPAALSCLTASCTWGPNAIARIPHHLRSYTRPAATQTHRMRAGKFPDLLRKYVCFQSHTSIHGCLKHSSAAGRLAWCAKSPPGVYPRPPILRLLHILTPFHRPLQCKTHLAQRDTPQRSPPPGVYQSAPKPIHSPRAFPISKIQP